MIITTLPVPSPAPLTLTGTGTRPFIPVIAGEEALCRYIVAVPPAEAERGDGQSEFAQLRRICGGNEDRVLGLLDQYDPDPESIWL